VARANSSRMTISDMESTMNSPRTGARNVIGFQFLTTSFVIS
jgi:hypothetical protein